MNYKVGTIYLPNLQLTIIRIFGGVKAEVLLLDGRKSTTYLKVAFNALERILRDIS